MPLTVPLALFMALGTILIQLWLLNDLLLGLSEKGLLYIYCGLIGCGLVFALVIGRLCTLIADSRAAKPVWLLPLTKSLAQRFDLLPPVIHPLTAPGLNAFALQGFSKRGHVLLNAAVLKQLNQDEIEAVLAHECSHLKRYHAMILTIVQGMILPMTMPVAAIAGLFYAFIYGLDKYRSAMLTLNHIMTVLLFPLTSIGIALFTRFWEFEADRLAANAIGSEKYIYALKCLHGSFFQHPNLLDIPVQASGQGRFAWALSHPSLAQRINALMEVGQR